ncbi:hypothetical protein F5B19DRAFT_502131 [Rostrohypoxylon terebratum]|nr:hypothetical protein F5B19DRAFT_502131 [Rostrohypoxylon terebratum]
MNTSLQLPPKLLDVLRILSFAPIALFAENLRVYQGIIYSVGSRSLAFPCLTGSIKDLQRLWYFSERELFGETPSEHKWSVSSLRHGNTFTLVNKRLLELAGVIGRPPPYDAAFGQVDYVRPTTVNISFISPKTKETESPATSYAGLWYIRGLTTLQLLVHTSIALGLGFGGLWSSSLLVSCIVASHLIMMVLRMTVTPTFANRAAVAKDSTTKASGGAALDIHVITSDWNSDSVNVICGYSSQLHSITNIPVRLRNFRFALWLCRLLILVLVVQAAILASLLGTQTDDALGPTVWLILYIMMLVPTEMSGKRYKTELLGVKSGSLTVAPPLIFKRRRTALLFIASLPVTQRTDRWSWLDPYMPNNPRRAQWLAEFETMRTRSHPSAQFSNADAHSPELKGVMSDIGHVLNSQPFSSYLESYKSAVGWTE